MPASYTSGQPSNPRRHPTCWASLQWSPTVSRTPWHGAWRPAPLSARPSVECGCTVPQIETPICTSRTITHHFSWQQHTCSELSGSPMECGVGDNPTSLHIFIPDTGTHPPEWPSQEEPGSGLTTSAQVSGVSAHALQIEYGLLCRPWMWHRRTNRRPCCHPMSSPSTSS